MIHINKERMQHKCLKWQSIVSLWVHSSHNNTTTALSSIHPRRAARLLTLFPAQNTFAIQKKKKKRRNSTKSLYDSSCNKVPVFVPCHCHEGINSCGYQRQKSGCFFFFPFTNGQEMRIKRGEKPHILTKIEPPGL